MIENPLKLADGFGGLTCREVRLAANVDGDQNSVSWNLLTSWLHQIDRLKQAA